MTDIPNIWIDKTEHSPKYRNSNIVQYNSSEIGEINATKKHEDVELT